MPSTVGVTYNNPLYMSVELAYGLDSQISLVPRPNSIEGFNDFDEIMMGISIFALQMTG